MGKISICILFFLAAAIGAHAQSDTAFWFAAPDLQQAHADRPIILRVATSGTPANITILQPANASFPLLSYTIPANSSQSIDLTAYINQIENGLANTISNKGLLIRSDALISCYYDFANTANGDMYALKGSNALGTQFTLPFQMELNNWIRSGVTFTTDFIIVATENNTTITITPKNNLVGHAAGAPFTITLNKGETYVFTSMSTLGPSKPGGTLVKSDKPIAITTKDDSLQIPSQPCGDTAGDQLIPDRLAGTEFVLLRGYLSLGIDYYFVFATENNTSITTSDGNTATINSGEYFFGKLYGESVYVSSSLPVHVFQVSGFGCEVGGAIIPSIKCTGSTQVNVTRATQGNEQFYLNLLAPANIIGNFSLNGTNTLVNPSSFSIVPGTNGKWMYARITIPLAIVSTGSSVVITNDKGKFHAGVIQGGPSSTARFGYFSDFSTNTIFLKDPRYPNTQLKDENIFCYKDTARLYVINSDVDINIRWSGPNGFSSNNGLLSFDSFLPKDTGLYTVTTISPGCGTASKSIRLKIDQPIAAFDFFTNGCIEDSVRIATDKNAGVRWRWNLGNERLIDTNSANLSPVKFVSAGEIAVSLTVGSSLGCFSDDTVRKVPLSTRPKAKYAVPAINCVNDQLVFKDESSITSGSIAKWKWNLDDGNGFREVENNADQSSQYTQWGNKKVQLVLVSNTGCVSDTFQLNSFKVNPLPKPGFTIPEVCLDDATAKFMNTTNSPDGFDQFTYQWKFNMGNNSVSPGPIFTSSQTTEKDPAIRYMSTGKYQVQLIVESRGCIDSITQSFKVNGTNPVPAFDILKAQTFCSNDTIKIINKSTIDFDNVTRLEIIWDKNNPSLITIDEDPQIGKIYSFRYPDFQFPLQKKIMVTLRAFSGDALSCSKTLSKEIILYASPKVNFTPLPSICLNGSAYQITEATYDAAVPGSFRYSGNGVSTTGSFDPVQAGVGYHDIRFVYTADNTGCKDSATRNITVWPLPEAIFEVATLRCEKNTTVMNSRSIANAGQLSGWIWNYGDGSPLDTIMTGERTEHIYSKWGEYNIALQVKTNNGCLSEPKTSKINVHPLPRITFSLPKICLPEARALFINNSFMPDGTDTWMSYRWDFDDPLNNTGSVSRDGTHAYSVAKTYNVKLMVTSRDDCKDSLTQIYTDIYPQPKAGFISEDSLCLGTSINLKDSSTPFFGNISEWYWKLGDNSNNTLESIQHNYGNAGIFNIQHYIKTSIGCISDTASKLVNVYDYPKISAGPDLAVLDDGQKKIAATAGGKILSYQWSPSIYLSSKDSLQPVIVRPKNDQVYTLMVTGRGNCISRDEMNMKVVTLPKPPNTFTPNGDGINDTWEIQYLDQYPDCQVEVYTSSGQIIYRSTGYPRAWDGKSNGRDLPAGTYYFVIDPKNGRPKMAGYVQILK